jgi:hypothetical protein
MPDSRLILLIPIMLLACAALICPKPSLSAIFLLFQSGLIVLLFGLSFAPGPLVLLCIFCVIVLVANAYLEKCAPRHVLTPKLNLALGFLLFLFFIFFVDRVKNLSLDYLNNLAQQDISFDALSLGGIIFIIFTIIISAFYILNLKHL